MSLNKTKIRNEQRKDDINKHLGDHCIKQGESMADYLSRKMKEVHSVESNRRGLRHVVY